MSHRRRRWISSVLRAPSRLQITLESPIHSPEGKAGTRRRCEAWWSKAEQYREVRIATQQSPDQ
eukprot:scaffold692_cov55-Cyclotella_meneghiniana.AAC.3